MRVAPAVGPGRYWLVVERIGWCCAWRKLGDALTGPQHDAPPVGGNAVGSADNKADNKGDQRGDSAAREDSDAAGGAGWSGAATAAAADGTVVLIAGAVLVRVRRTRRSA
ncbi:hypothetical protein [Streptomyces sp. NBC_00829]|uniref:hypothetical protein n=1 Tax=Streptomyces sp. NBC_00829 TaxID=2903679 RepID=UPI0038709E41|nr:hypothetical protein OG293_17455 [Streptomyces sp. NBC_00829]